MARLSFHVVVQGDVSNDCAAAFAEHVKAFTEASEQAGLDVRGNGLHVRWDDLPLVVEAEPEPVTVDLPAEAETHDHQIPTDRTIE